MPKKTAFAHSVGFGASMFPGVVTALGFQPDLVWAEDMWKEEEGDSSSGEAEVEDEMSPRSLGLFCFGGSPCGRLDPVVRTHVCQVCAVAYEAHILDTEELKLMRFAALLARRSTNDPMADAFERWLDGTDSSSWRTSRVCPWRRPGGGLDNFTSKWPSSLPRPYTASPHAFYAVESRAWAVALAIRLGSVLPTPIAPSSRKFRGKSGQRRRTKKTRAKRHERDRKSAKAAAASGGAQKAMAASDGAGAGAGGGCTGSRGAAR